MKIFLVFLRQYICIIPPEFAKLSVTVNDVLYTIPSQYSTTTDGWRLCILKAIPAHNWQFMSEQEIRCNFNDWDYNQFSGFKDVIEATATFESKICSLESS